MSKLLSCPDAVCWNDMLDGRMTPHEQSALSQHLETCAECQRTLEQLTACDASWPRSAKMLKRRKRPALAQAMDRLKADAEQALATVGQETVAMNEMPFLQTPMNPEKLGRIGKYEVQAVIGRGGMGVVLKAYDRMRGRTVAIKVLAPQLATTENARKRFEREAIVAQDVVHKHVVAIYEVNQVQGLPFLVMEYVAGASLQERLDRHGPPDVDEIVRISMQTAAGLAAAHARDLIHRDVKPANILLEEKTGDVKLSDFGLARAVDDASLTQSGVIAGTPQFMAPEQARGGALDHRADLFSLGSVMYTMCTGRPPFRADSTLAVLNCVCDDTPQPIRELNPDIPEWLVDVIERLHAKRPDDRFGSAREVVKLLETHARKVRSPEKPVRRVNRLRKEVSRSWLAPTLVIGGILMAVLFACGGVGVYFFLPDGKPANDKGQVAQNANEQQPPLNLQIPQIQPALPPLQGPRGPAAKVTGNLEIDEALADLVEVNPFTTPAAARRLAAMPPKEHRAVVADKLAGLADIGDPHVRRPVVNALAIWSTPKEVPALIKALQHSDVFTRREALKEIGKLRHKDTVAPVVRCFQDFHTRAEAATALRDLGPMAEKEVLTLMDQTDVFLKQAAIDVLRDIGTQASVPALNAALAANSPFLTDHSRSALAAIAARGKK